MSIVLKGYQIFNQIYAGKTTVVYRGASIDAQKPVVIKVLKHPYPTLFQLDKFRNQYIITKNLGLEGVVKTNALETFGNGLALVMEWGGISLADYCATDNYTPLAGKNIQEFFELAIKFAKILEELQQNSIVHQQLRPKHFLINPETKQVKLTDFTLAAVLPKDTQLRPISSLEEDNLGYIAPEQTGRMSCGIDHRSDLYGLGIIFYQLLVGQLPFNARDRVELAYSHLAVAPPTPSQINPQIPAPVSKIILKLLAKNPQSRYQTAVGLRYDLEQCQQQWLTSKTFWEFNLGTRDIGDRLPIPAKLYGREAEVATLLDAYRRVSQGNREIVLVGGFSGVGKTALVEQVQKSIDRQSYFIGGKFDQFQRHQPFSAVVSAFRDLIGQLQTESQASLKAWRGRLFEALGENSQIITDVIPELENIIGVGPPATELDAQAAQNRFNLTFINFVSVFAARQHPLIIFLDDLQWADRASLELIQLLVNSTTTESLLLIGAYRDNEVNAVHPLMLKLKEIEQQINLTHNKTVAIEYIRLSPLPRAALNRMIGETLSCSDELALPLTDLIWQTTGGNPFFTIQLLQHWHEERLIHFNYEKAGWQCELAKIRVLAVSDDVVEFMVQRLEKLPYQVQQVLKIAACIGNKFDLNTLAIAYNKSLVDTAIDLSTAIGAGLVLPISQIHPFFQDCDTIESANDLTNSVRFNQTASTSIKVGLQLSASSVETKINLTQVTPYQFLHDRVQQAAYRSIGAAQKPLIHRQIGQMLLAQTTAEAEETNVFAIVNHLNLAVELIESPTEKQQLAELNLQAGFKAKAATAYGSALSYFSTGLQLLDWDCWQVEYELTLALSLATAEAAYLCGNFEQMEQLITTILQQARNLGDRVVAYQIQIQAQIARGNPLGAVKIALSTLKLFGRHYPLKPGKWRVVLALIRTKLAMRGRKIEDLIHLPIAKRADVIAMGKIMYTVGSPCYNTAFELVPLIALTSVNFSIKYGNAPISAYAYVSYSVILCGVLGDIEAGYRFGKLALNLVDKLQLKDQKARTMMVFNNFVRHWKEHLQASSEPLLQAYTIGLETGDLEFASYAAYIHCYHGYFLGHELTELEGKMKAYGEAISQFGQKTALRLHRIYHQATLNLLVQNSEPWNLTGEVFDEQVELEIIKGVNHRTALFYIFFHKLIFSYWFGHPEKAAKYVKYAQKYIDSAISTASIPIFYFYDSLIGLSCCSQVNLPTHKIIRRVNRNQKKLKKWAKFAPMNCLHKFYLVEAEKHRVKGEYLQAIDNYDQAIKLAQEHKYINEQALAQELAAQFYLIWGKEQIAQLYWTDAYYSYARWGANAKVKDLGQKYPQFFHAVQYQTESNPLPSITSPQTNLNNLNVATVIQTIQAASKEIQIEHLLSSLIEIMIKNTGAETGYLILLGRKSESLLIGTNRIHEIENQYLDLNQSGDRLPVSLINYVRNNQQPVVYGGENPAFAWDPYITEHQTKSILCMPILNKNNLIGIVYLENKLVSNLFTQEQIELLKLLCCQAVIALENATLYLNLKQSEQREKQKTQQLKSYLNKLQQSQKKLIETQKQLRHDAFHDALTDLPNRIWLTKILQKSIELNNQNSTYQYGFLFLDLDRFKVINDSLGHLVGDELLKQVAQRLNNSIRHTDTVCRLGGDEFAILLKGIEHHQEAIDIAQRIKTQLGQPFYINQYEIYTGTSIGITFSSFNYQKPEDILRDADAAMYQAKSQGKGQYLVFDQNMQSEVAANLELENALRAAIGVGDRLFLHYQPIISLSTNGLVGFEALLRWHDPQRGWISPAEFIPIAEETGLINDIGWWVIESACQQLSRWRDRFPQHPIAINVNLSALQLKQENLVTRFKQIIHQNQIPPFCLKLEITESCLLETYSIEGQILNQLKDLGVGLCIDDFGTGYSSLSRLHEFPIDTLKIDRSFIRNLHSIAKQDQTVQTIITLAHSLGMDVVAEGVETIEQLQQLQQLGCEYVQGYLFSKPVDSEAATELLSVFK